MASKTVSRRILDPGSLNSICPSCRLAASSLTLPYRTRRYASFYDVNKRAGPATGKFEKERKEFNERMRRERKQNALKPKEEDTKDVEAKDKPNDSSQGLEKGMPSEDSIFGEPKEEGDKEVRAAELADEDPSIPKALHDEIDPEALLNVLEPEPQKTMAWRRRRLIQAVRNRDVLTKEQLLKRTERELHYHSPYFQTSTKKLMHLARQIAGKPIEDAIAQMQLSKKKTAQDVWRSLEHARNTAIVERGMGLGKAEGRMGDPVEIEDKDGKRKKITDRTGIYVDQAWVNKGDSTQGVEYRGRGRVFGITHRTAKFSVILKENATRIRLSQERQEKLNNKKLWLHLPDRPVTLQRQYPLW